MRIYVPSTNLIYIEQLLKEGWLVSNEKSSMIPTKSICPNPSKRQKKVQYIVLFKN
jgi:hypothetical protein